MTVNTITFIGRTDGRWDTFIGRIHSRLSHYTEKSTFQLLNFSTVFTLPSGAPCTASPAPCARPRFRFGLARSNREPRFAAATLVRRYCVETSLGAAGDDFADYLNGHTRHGDCADDDYRDLCMLSAVMTRSSCSLTTTDSGTFLQERR